MYFFLPQLIHKPVNLPLDNRELTVHEYMHIYQSVYPGLNLYYWKLIDVLGPVYLHHCMYFNPLKPKLA
jgi:hypothetical protein